MEQLLKLRFLSVLLLSSCSIFQQFEDTYEQRFQAHNVVKISELQSAELANVNKPVIKPVVAVYPTAFTDQTGQRKSNSEFALFSTAVTQQPSSLLIRALKHAAHGQFFTVVERVGLDNLTKERQLIRSAREQTLSDEEKKKAEAAAGFSNGVPYTIIKVETPIKLVPDKPRIDPVSGKEIDPQSRRLT